MAQFSRPPETPAGIYPYLTVRDGKGAVAFYEAAFGAEELMRNVGDDSGLIMHSRLKINGAVVMLSDDFGRSEGPPRGVTLHLQVDDAQAWWDRAVAAGAKVRMALADQPWGDRYGQLEDPFGHGWSIAETV